jgi:HicB family
MKRIIEGVTYNTDTATVVAKWEYKDQDHYDTDATLYQTRGGAFFIVHEWNVEEKAKVYFEAISRDGVSRLVERTNNLDILDDEILQNPPEAAEESAPSATLYVRVPASLKDRLEFLAIDAGVSLNAWTMRCVERCASLEDAGLCLGGIISTGMALGSEPEPGAYSEATVRAMVEHMREEAEEAARILGWRSRQEIESLSEKVAGTSHSRTFKPYQDQP